MGFFARPRLSNDQFVQHSSIDGQPSDVLTLSGQTQIGTTSGLTLIGDNGTGIYGDNLEYIPIQATGATDYEVMTYQGGVIKLMPLSGSSGSGIYSGASPTTCTVGGLDSGTTIGGCSISCIIEQMVSPVLSPITGATDNTLSLLPPVIYYEVGCSLSLSMVSTFDRGDVVPVYCGGSSYVAGLPTTHIFCPNWNPVVCVTCPDITWIEPYVTPIGPGINPFESAVVYSSGATPIFKSDGTEFAPAKPSGQTGFVTDALCGIYPWYWGKITCAVPAGDCRPSAACIKHEMTGNTCTGSSTGNKVVASSIGTICTNFNSTVDDYLWFATPSGSTSKTCWYVNTLNSGLIGGAISPAGNLFPASVTITGVTSVGTGSWSGQSYKVYVSNKQTPSTSIMQLRNS